MKRHVKRRTMLKGLGAGALLAATPMLRRARIFAQQAQVPKRVLFFYAGTGNLPTHPYENQRAPGHWEPLAPSGMSDPTETEFELNTTMAALEPYKQDLILFENLDMAQHHVDPTFPADAHVGGASIAMTAANRFNERLPGDISIDQLIARELNTPAPVTRLPSLDVFCAHFMMQRSETTATGPGEPVPLLYHAPDVYDRAFPEPPGDDPDAQDAAAARAMQRERVFDFVDSQGMLLHDRLPAEDREKVQQHLDAVSDLRRRLTLSGSTSASVPDRSIVDPWMAQYSPQQSPSEQTETWHMSTDINTQIAVAALHADVTRVATLQVFDPPDHAFGFSPGQHGADSGHDLQHMANNPDAPQYTNTDARDVLRRQQELQLDKFKNVLDQLAARTESDGQRLLDHTLVIYCSQIGNGSHDLMRLPWIVAGSSNGYFRTGRYIRLPRTRPDWMPHDMDVGRPHNDLFVSIANAMGVGISSFGNAEISSGPIEQMR